MPSLTSFRSRFRYALPVACTATLLSLAAAICSERATQLARPRNVLRAWPRGLHRLSRLGTLALATTASILLRPFAAAALEIGRAHV